MTIKIDQAARQATFQTPMLGEMQGELKASDESYVAHVDLAKAHAHMGRTINAVDMNVNRFTGGSRSPTCSPMARSIRRSPASASRRRRSSDGPAGDQLPP